MNILVLSAYDADSHQRWHQGLVQHLPFDFNVHTLPARFFSWRIRGNPLTWALGHKAELTAKPWHLIIATSMVDLATLKGLMPELAAVPTLVYFHENQFVYPTTAHSHQSIEPQMVTLYSALAAKHVVFNSHFNKTTFLQGVADLLKKLPDQVPNGIVELLNTKSSVIPVPLEAVYFELAAQRKNEDQPFTIVWNHRWEYDKGPELLLAIIQHLQKTAPNLKMRWHIVGQQFRSVPTAFAEIKKQLIAQDWLGQWGYLSRADYQQVLQQSDVVLSTALHDFQGLAVMEAAAAGCIPLLPKRVAYPDFFADDYLYDVAGNVAADVAENVPQQANNACQKIQQLIKSNNRPPAPNMQQYGWPQLQQDYQNLIQTLALPV
ncbi:MAG: DUF3524 domain-containing protein [Marinagarivorans sp.]|nr:DUF3524 domain-containing protein [Marinagarivorans sp.]